jgi:hypothetical protein
MFNKSVQQGMQRRTRNTYSLQNKLADPGPSTEFTKASEHWPELSIHEVYYVDSIESIYLFVGSHYPHISAGASSCLESTILY